MDWAAHDANASAARELFSFEERQEGEEPVAYFNAAYLSPQLRSAARAAAEEGLKVQQQPWQIKYPDAFNAPCERVRSLFAQVLGCDADGVALVPSVSYAVSVVADNRRGIVNRILVLGEQYQSNVLGWLRLAEDTGGEVIFVPPLPPGEDWTPAAEAAVREHKPTLAALPAACHWCDGTTLDASVVAAACREVGAEVFLDATQSLGVVKLDLDAVQPDFVAVAAYKWLMCPYSVSFLYVAEPLRETLRPLELHGGTLERGGFLPDGSYDVRKLYDMLPQGYARGARRFDSGERSNFITLAMAEVGLAQVLEWQATDAVAKHTRPLLDLICERAAALGLLVPSPEQRAPHIVGLRVPDATPDKLAKLAVALRERKVLVSIRADAVRVAPHMWSDRADAERLLEVLEAQLGGGGGDGDGDGSAH